MSAHQDIGSGFQQYLLQQQKERWDIHYVKSNLVKQEVHFFENEKSDHYQNIVKFTTESPEESVFKQIDVKKSEEVLKMVETYLESLSELKLKVDSKQKRLFTEDHVLKKHAVDENEHWNNVLANINEIREKTQKCINQITFVRSHI